MVNRTRRKGRRILC